MKASLLCAGLLALSSGAALANPDVGNATGSTGGSPTLQQVVQSPNKYVGSTLTLTGKVDRLLPSGDFILKAPDSNQSLLVLTVKPPTAKSTGNQQAGVAAPSVSNLKEGQNVRVTGRGDQLVITNEYDVLNMKKNSESVDITRTSTPILIVRPGDIQPQG